MRAPTQDHTADTASSTTTSASRTRTARGHDAASWQAVARSAMCVAVAKMAVLLETAVVRKEKKTQCKLSNKINFIKLMRLHSFFNEVTYFFQ